MTEACSPSRAAYIVKVGKKYWSRDAARKRAGVKIKREDRHLKGFYGAGIITSLAVARRVANRYRGKVVPVSITLS